MKPCQEQNQVFRKENYLYDKRRQWQWWTILFKQRSSEEELLFSRLKNFFSIRQVHKNNFISFSWWCLAYHHPNIYLCSCVDLYVSIAYSELVAGIGVLIYVEVTFQNAYCKLWRSKLCLVNFLVINGQDFDFSREYFVNNSVSTWNITWISITNFVWNKYHFLALQNVSFLSFKIVMVSFLL